jgi:hypothetical protein
VNSSLMARVSRGQGRVREQDGVQAAVVDGEVRGRATPARDDPRRGLRRPNQPATARVSGLWACERASEK